MVYRKCKKNYVMPEGVILKAGETYCTEPQLHRSPGKPTLVQVWSGYIFLAPVEEYFEPHEADEWDNLTYEV